MYTLVYDFETSGLNPFHDDVIEIGCKCLETDESFSVLVQPLSNRLICDKITEITGISNKILVRDGIQTKEAFIQFFDFIYKHYEVTFTRIMSKLISQQRFVNNINLL